MNLLHSNKDIKSLTLELNTELGSLKDWLIANCLSVNLEKAKFLIFATKKIFKQLKNIPITICFSKGNFLKSATYTKTRELGLAH